MVHSIGAKPDTKCTNPSLNTNDTAKELDISAPAIFLFHPKIYSKKSKMCTRDKPTTIVTKGTAFDNNSTALEHPMKEHGAFFENTVAPVGFRYVEEAVPECSLHSITVRLDMDKVWTPVCRSGSNPTKILTSDDALGTEHSLASKNAHVTVVGTRSGPKHGDNP